MTDTNTNDDDTTAIETVAVTHAQMNETILALASELGLTSRDLETGAAPAEREAKAQKAALFGAAKAAEEFAADDRSPAEIAAALMQQNAQNLARVAQEAGVSKRNIPLDAGTSKVEAQKAALFTDREESEKSIADPENRDALHRFMYPGGAPSWYAGDGWSRADPDPAAGDRR